MRELQEDANVGQRAHIYQENGDPSGIVSAHIQGQVQSFLNKQINRNKSYSFSLKDTS